MVVDNVDHMEMGQVQKDANKEVDDGMEYQVEVDNVVP